MPADEAKETAPTRKYERTIPLPDLWFGEGDDATDLSTLAQVAALAHEYAEKVEAGMATSDDVSTLVCHCTVLADDLFDLAVLVSKERAQ